MDSPVRRWRAALYMSTLVAGLEMASWVARTPAIRDALDVSTGSMGMVLFGLSTGSMTGVLASGGLVRRYGGRSVIGVGAALTVVGLVVIAGSAPASLAVGVFCGLAVFGAGLGVAEIALNIEGAALEKAVGRPVLPMLHGCFSLGTVAGALLGMGMTAVRFPVGWHLSAVAVLAAVVSLWAVRSIPGGTGRAVADDGRTQGHEGWRSQLRVWREPNLVLIGVIVLAMAFAEGSANDWLPLLMVDGHGTSATAGSLAFTAFAAAMTAGRFLGGPVLGRFGRTAVVRVCALLAATGLALVIFSSDPLIAGAAVVLWGLGASLGFPVAISAAGEGPGNSAARVGAVATAGYLAFLVGPPSLGFLADHIGLRGAMTVVLALVAGASLVTHSLQPRDRHACADGDGAPVDGGLPEAVPEAVGEASGAEVGGRERSVEHLADGSRPGGPSR